MAKALPRPLEAPVMNQTLQVLSGLGGDDGVENKDMLVCRKLCCRAKEAEKAQIVKGKNRDKKLETKSQAFFSRKIFSARFRK